MEPTWLSVIELRPLPEGALGVAISVRPSTALEPTSRDGLTCLFEEPAEVAIRLRVGSARFEPGGGLVTDEAVGLGIWPGCLPRLSRAGVGLRTHDVTALAAPLEVTNPAGVWFEVEPTTGTWQRVAVSHVQSSFVDVRRDARVKPFFVHAAGDADDVHALLCALRDGTVDEPSDA